MNNINTTSNASSNTNYQHHALLYHLLTPALLIASRVQRRGLAEGLKNNRRTKGAGSSNHSANAKNDAGFDKIVAPEVEALSSATTMSSKKSSEAKPARSYAYSTGPISQYHPPRTARVTEVVLQNDLLCQYGGLLSEPNLPSDFLFKVVAKEEAMMPSLFDLYIRGCAEMSKMKRDQTIMNGRGKFVRPKVAKVGEALKEDIQINGSSDASIFECSSCGLQCSDSGSQSSSSSPGRSPTIFPRSLSSFSSPPTAERDLPGTFFNTTTTRQASSKDSGGFVALDATATLGGHRRTVYSKGYLLEETLAETLASAAAARAASAAVTAEVAQMEYEQQQTSGNVGGGKKSITNNNIKSKKVNNQSGPPELSTTPILSSPTSDTTLVLPFESICIELPSTPARYTHCLSLSVVGERSLGLWGLRALFRTIGRMSGLRELRLSGCGLGSEVGGGRLCRPNQMAAEDKKSDETHLSYASLALTELLHVLSCGRQPKVQKQLRGRGSSFASTTKSSTLAAAPPPCSLNLSFLDLSNNDLNDEDGELLLSFLEGKSLLGGYCPSFNETSTGLASSPLSITRVAVQGNPKMSATIVAKITEAVRVHRRRIGAAGQEVSESTTLTSFSEARDRMWLVPPSTPGRLGKVVSEPRTPVPPKTPSTTLAVAAFNRALGVSDARSGPTTNHIAMNDSHDDLLLRTHNNEFLRQSERFSSLLPSSGYHGSQTVLIDPRPNISNETFSANTAAAMSSPRRRGQYASPTLSANARHAHAANPNIKSLPSLSASRPRSPPTPQITEAKHRARNTTASFLVDSNSLTDTRKSAAPSSPTKRATGDQGQPSLPPVALLPKEPFFAAMRAFDGLCSPNGTVPLGLLAKALPSTFSLYRRQRLELRTQLESSSVPTLPATVLARKSYAFRAPSDAAEAIGTSSTLTAPTSTQPSVASGVDGLGDASITVNLIQFLQAVFHGYAREVIIRTLMYFSEYSIVQNAGGRSVGGGSAGGYGSSYDTQSAMLSPQATSAPSSPKSATALSSTDTSDIAVSKLREDQKQEIASMFVQLDEARIGRLPMELLCCLTPEELLQVSSERSQCCGPELSHMLRNTEFGSGRGVRSSIISVSPSSGNVRGDRTTSMAETVSERDGHPLLGGDGEEGRLLLWLSAPLASFEWLAVADDGLFQEGDALNSTDIDVDSAMEEIHPGEGSTSPTISMITSLNTRAELARVASALRHHGIHPRGLDAAAFTRLMAPYFLDTKKRRPRMQQ